jgi:hypothetical protein
MIVPSTRRQRIFSILAPGVIALSVALSACAPGSPGTTQEQAGQQAAQAVPTVVAMATQVAPQAQAAATQVAPQAQAVATQVAQSPIGISNVRAQVDNLTVTLRNTSNQPVNLGGYTLRVGNMPYTLPQSAAAMAPGATMSIHTGQGTNTASDVYLGQDAAAVISAAAANPSVALIAPGGNVIAEAAVPATAAGR